MSRIPTRGLIPVFLLAVEFLFLSCEESFSPKAPFEEKLVVFSLLTAARDTQYVVVSRTYDVEGFDPLQNREAPEVAGADVRIIADDGTSVMLRDTIVQRSDSVRYGPDRVAYYVPSFRILPRRVYRLEVKSPTDGEVSASFQTGDPVRIGRSVDVETQDFTAFATSAGSKGFLIRLYLVYRVTSGGNVIQKEAEVPQFFSRDGTPVYPQVDRQNQLVIYGDVVLRFKARIAAQEAPGVIDEVGKKVVVWALDANAYNYYQIVRGFNDPLSVRVDLPDYSNIEGGLGVFGGILADSLFFSTL